MIFFFRTSAVEGAFGYFCARLSKSNARPARTVESGSRMKFAIKIGRPMAAPTVLIKFVDVLVADMSSHVPTMYAMQGKRAHRLTFGVASGHS